MKLSWAAIKHGGKGIMRAAQAKSPELLAGLAIAGVVMLVVEAVKAGPKVMDAKEEAERDIDDLKTLGEMDKAAKRKVLLVAAKRIGFALIPTFVTAFITIACIVGSLYFNNRQKAVLAAAATISENSLREYKDKARDLLGEKKADQIEDDIIADKIRSALDEGDVVETGHGSDMFYDNFTGQIFRSNIDYVRRVALDMQTMLRDGDDPRVSDLQHALGIRESEYADDYVLRGIGRGSNVTFEFRFSPHPKPHEEGKYITAIVYCTQAIGKDSYYYH